jgi:hypothetical protein
VNGAKQKGDRNAHNPHIGNWSKYWLGEGNANRNFPMPRYATNSHYKELFEKVIFPMLNDFQPEVIFLGAGFDAMIGDGFGRMNLTHSFFAWLTAQLAIGGPHFRAASRKLPKVVNNVNVVKDNTVHVKDSQSQPAQGTKSKKQVVSKEAETRDYLNKAYPNLTLPTDPKWKWGHLVVMTEGGYLEHNVMHASKAIINCLEKATHTLRNVANDVNDEAELLSNPLVAALKAKENLEEKTVEEAQKSDTVSPFSNPGVLTPETEAEVAKQLVSLGFVQSEEQATNALVKFAAYVMGLDLQMSLPKFMETGTNVKIPRENAQNGDEAANQTSREVSGEQENGKDEKKNKRGNQGSNFSSGYKELTSVAPNHNATLYKAINDLKEFHGKLKFPVQH